jgi:TetR/AcrR family transcriptional repressor of bet genes
MPKQVDHNARRRQIAEALWRIASRGGLEAASLNEVAAEAGVSKGMVQHYFQTRDDILVFASQLLQARVEQRVNRSLAEESSRASPRAVLRAVLRGLLPTDDDSRTEMLVASAFFVRALGEPALAARYRDGQRLILDAIGGLIRQAQEAGELIAPLDVAREAEVLLSVVESLGSALLLGRHTRKTAQGLIDHQLAHLTRSPRLARRRASP